MKDPKGRIVVVDDEEEMRSLLRDFFQDQQGYDVVAFPLAKAALEALSPGGRLSAEHSEGDIDVIISDIKMPEMDGLEFTTQVRSLRPEIPIVVATAFGSIETAIAAMQRGAFHYIVKPFKLTEIGLTVE